MSRNMRNTEHDSVKTGCAKPDLRNKLPDGNWSTNIPTIRPKESAPVYIPPDNFGDGNYTVLIPSWSLPR